MIYVLIVVGVIGMCWAIGPGTQRWARRVERDAVHTAWLETGGLYERFGFGIPPCECGDCRHARDLSGGRWTPMRRA